MVEMDRGGSSTVAAGSQWNLDFQDYWREWMLFNTSNVNSPARAMLTRMTDSLLPRLARLASRK